MEKVNLRVTYESVVPETGEIKHRNRNFLDIPSTMTKEEVKLFARLFCYVNKLAFVKITITIEMSETEEEKGLFKNTSNLLNFEQLLPLLDEEKKPQSRQTKKPTAKKTNQKQTKTATTPKNKPSVTNLKNENNLQATQLSNTLKQSSVNPSPEAALPLVELVETPSNQDSILKEKLIIQKPKGTPTKKKMLNSTKKRKTLGKQEIVEEIEIEFDDFLNLIGDKDKLSHIEDKIFNGDKDKLETERRRLNVKANF